MMTPLLLACFGCIPQDPAAGAAPVPGSIAVQLTARVPAAGERLSWSPKGATVPLAAKDGALVGEFALGPAAVRPLRVELSRSAADGRFDRLAIDLDRDGSFGEAERLTTTAKEQRGKWWSSFEATAMVPFAGRKEPLPYPLSLWFVADPSEPDAAPALRWSRRGWSDGEVVIDGKPAFVLVTEMVMDGVFTERDAWFLARDRKALLAGASRGLDSHCWLDGKAWRATGLAADGSSLQLEPFTPELSEAQERDRADATKADRAAKRAAQPLAFGKDLAAALAAAKRDGKRVFVDFETTWCGPCKQMDQLVYTAADVVDAANAGGLIAVKLDGDEQKALVKQYEVKGYPTLLLLDADGKVLRRAVGYQGVAATAKFFAN